MQLLLERDQHHLHTLIVRKQMISGYILQNVLAPFRSTLKFVRIPVPHLNFRTPPHTWWKALRYVYYLHGQISILKIHPRYTQGCSIKIGPRCHMPYYIFISLPLFHHFYWLLDPCSTITVTPLIFQCQVGYRVALVK